MASAVPFHESRLLSTPVRDLGLTIAGTPLDPWLGEFQQELERVGIRRLKPHFYLSNEWGVPFQTISIGIPFYLARQDLTAVHAERVGHLEGASRVDLFRYLRHEMGHVVNYGYKLYEQEEWIKHFGSITQPYLEEYRPEPFSRRYVRHLPGWYAQKHPDEDWSETFAVWMTPHYDWRAAYADWPEALAKLDYCDSNDGRTQPARSRGDGHGELRRRERVDWFAGGVLPQFGDARRPVAAGPRRRPASDLRGFWRAGGSLSSAPRRPASN